MKIKLLLKYTFEKNEKQIFINYVKFKICIIYFSNKLPF